MPIFDFAEIPLNSNQFHPKKIGHVKSVDNGNIYLQVDSGDKLQLLRIGSLMAIPGSGGRYIIAMVSRIWRERPPDKDKRDSVLTEDIEELAIPEDSGALLALLGCVRERISGTQFSRSMDELPGIDEQVFLLADKNLNNFMNVVSTNSKTAKNTPLHFGQFSLDLKADAFLDGNKLFQRHAALLGSTGSGKSWAVARILEQAHQLPDANIILLDLHGEYEKLSYAKQYRIAGPADLASPEANVLFLPYWLLSFEEMQALLVEHTEHTAHNQTLAIHSIVSELKKETLQELGKTEVLSQFTINSPVPFSIDKVIQNITELNSERVHGSTGRQKNGDFHGQFSRLLARLESKKSDRRYGFMYQAPQAWSDYKALHRLTECLLDFGPSNTGTTKGIKVINLSEVPTDVLPVVVGTLARLIFQLQFWTPPECRHPILIACDEAHLYLPKQQNANPLERAAVENMERIAKEGRKYGVGLMVISQRPSDVSETILSQCNNIISLRLTNPTDQQTVKALLPDNLGNISQVLPLMDVGEAIVVGDAVLLPTLIKIQPPTEPPTSTTIAFWDEWGNAGTRTSEFYARIAENIRKQERT